MGEKNMRRIGILTGGGDAPGLNAVIRAVVKYGVGTYGWELFGIEESFNGLMFANKQIWTLTPKTCQGLLHKGGTILGTTNRGSPFTAQSNGIVPAQTLKEKFAEMNLEGLIVIGGDGTQAIGYRLMTEYGIPVIGVPKTIDNDLKATDFTFGFWSAVDVATDALDRLHTTAESHDRVMILEVMGRTAGWIALYAGVAGGSDCIVLPELPYDHQKFVEKIELRQSRGRHFTIIVIAEGAMPKESIPIPPHTKGAGNILAALLEQEISAEIRVTVLGHLQRGGSPIPFDRVLATRYGIKAVEMVEQNQWGHLACLKNGQMSTISLADVAGEPREVSTKDELIRVARATGVEFGDS